jgi:aminoglycoside phosphotransferase (APT) family kinase protein
MNTTEDPLLGSGNVAEVFAHGSRVFKLYKHFAAKPAAFREAALHAAVEAMGLPVPRVWSVEEVDGRWGIVFDRIHGPSLAESMRAAPAAVSGYLDTMVPLHLRIHEQTATGFPSVKRRLAASIDAASQLNVARREALLAGLAALPDGDRLCHGDFHPMNILGDAAHPMIIDWPDAARGDPAADCSRSYLLLRIHAADLAEPYLGRYFRLAGIARDSVLRWLPCVAAARLIESVPGEIDRLLAIVL